MKTDSNKKLHSKIPQERKAYVRARRRALARLRKGFDLSWVRPANLEEIHERSGRFVS